MTYSSKFRKLFQALVLFLCLFGTKVSNASHYAAVDIIVQYAGTGPNDLTYKVIVDIYYACQGGAPPAAAGPVYYFSANEGGALNGSYINNRSFNCPQVGTEIIVDQLCEDKKDENSCNLAGSPLPGFKWWRSEGTVTLTSRQSDWVFYWSGSARNTGILNLASPGTIFVDAGLDNLIRYDNSTPIFTVTPLPYLCKDQPSTYLNNPFDPTGDSISVSSVIPREGPAAFCAYDPSYSFANPIASTAGNPYTVDINTGAATFTPQNLGFFVLAFRVDKYDRKTKKRIGFANRDVQVSVLDCQGAPPDVTDPQNISFGELDDNEFTTCSGVRFNFDINSTTTLPNRNLYMEANLTNLPGATLTLTGDGTSNVTGTFSWAPHFGNIGEHILVVTTKDSTCDAASPIVFKAYKVILLRVLPNIDAGVDQPVCYEGGTPIPIYVKGGDNYKLNWSNLDGSSPTTLSADTGQLVYAKPTATTTYVVSTNDLPPICKNKDTVTVFIDTSVKIATFPISVFPEAIVMCRPGYLQLDATITGKPPISSISCGTGDTSKAVTFDSLTVNGGLGGNYDTLGPLTPTLPVNYASVKQQFFIRKADLFESGFLYGTMKSIAIDAINPTAFQYSNFKIAIKCTPDDKISRVTGFEDGMTNVYTATDQTTLVTGWNKFKFSKPYSWDTSQNLIVEICYSGNTPLQPASDNPIIRFVPTDHISNLILAETTIPDACPVLTSLLIKENYARPQFRFDFYETVPKDFQFRWEPGVLLSDSTIPQPLAYVPQSINYIASTIGRNGCVVRDTAEIYVPIHNYSVTPADTAMCFGEHTTLTAKGGANYRWWEYVNGEYVTPTSLSNALVANPVVTPKVTTTYKIVVYDSVWCTDTIEMKVTVLPLPDVHILNRDTIVKYGQSLQLLVGGARQYNWMPAGTISTPFSSNPVATPKEATQYMVGGIGTNGCRAFDTVNVAVDYRNGLLIPTGFSPNGDGRNDRFRVANLTFQRLTEFRVFNRWGQEIYSGLNADGWDGTWKGVPQDIGNYQYIIRIAYPDGLVESYKGDVTLLR